MRAWGETGLDFNRMFSAQPDQEKWFVRQMEVADHLGLPLIFHERDSRGRFLKLLSKTRNHIRQPDFISDREFDPETTIFELTIRYDFGQIRAAPADAPDETDKYEVL